MNKVDLAQALHPLTREKAGDTETEKSQTILRILYNALMSGNEKVLDAITKVAEETQECDYEYNKKHGRHPNTSRRHDRPYR